MTVENFEVVTIQIIPGQLLNVTNTRQVGELLTEKWPALYRGKAYAVAVKACMDQIEGRKNASAVRKAFIAAAKEARIFVHEGWRT